MKTTKTFFLDFERITYTNRFFIPSTSNRSFFLALFQCFIAKILLQQAFYLEKAFICNFCYTYLFPSCNISFESCWSVDFKYLYFHYWKGFILFISFLINISYVQLIFLTPIQNAIYNKFILQSNKVQMEKL